MYYQFLTITFIFTVDYVWEELSGFQTRASVERSYVILFHCVSILDTEWHFELFSPGPVVQQEKLNI